VTRPERLDGIRIVRVQFQRHAPFIRKDPKGSPNPFDHLMSQTPCQERPMMIVDAVIIIKMDVS